MSYVQERQPCISACCKHSADAWYPCGESTPAACTQGLQIIQLQLWQHVQLQHCFQHRWQMECLCHAPPAFLAMTCIVNKLVSGGIGLLAS